MDGLSLDNILDDNQMSDLFSDEGTQESQTPEEKDKETNKEPETTEVDTNTLFDDIPESVGSEGDDKHGQEDTDSTKSSTSPNFYSSIASALVADGVFQNHDDVDLSTINDADKFAEFMNEQVKNQLDERQKRIDEALNYGVAPSEIQKYERYMATLDNITEEAIAEESERGENLRKNIIFQDLINKGFTQDKATKYVERAMKGGTDIEDAKEALQSNKDYFKGEYEKLVKENKDRELKEIEEHKKKAESLRKSILEEDKAFGELTIDKKTRQKVYDNISKPIWTDPKTGERYTALQKYELENRSEFMKNLGLIFTLTDGFKNLDGLVGGKVKKEMKKGIRELENTINNTQRTTDGNLSFISQDPESRISKFELDL